MSASKSIAKNTLFLYVRMFFILAVSLYTSRVILQYLGVEDFGLYNLVAGVVVLFSFLNGAMTAATQRFINFEKASDDVIKINHVFCISMNIYFLICAIVFLLGETVGLWFLNVKLNIGDDRMFAANVIYQISLITTIINILRVPYNAVILAYQRMSFYAFLGIVETVGKLLIVFSLALFSFDRLIVYSILLACLTLAINCFYYLFCVRNFKEQTTYRYIKDKVLFSKMTVFSGWSLFGNVALMGTNQGVNIILNIFFGVLINATIGIANQVNTAIYSFISNFQTAFMPRITQSYAENKMEEHQKLVLQTSKMSFYLLILISLPILINTEFVMTFWLGKFPDYAVQFTKLIIVFSLFDALSGPLWMSINAVGNIRVYQLVISCLLILNLPLSYLLLHLDYSPISVMVLKVVINFLVFIFRIIYVNRKIGFSRVMVLKYVSQLSLIVVTLSLLYYLFDQSGKINNTLNAAIVSTISVLILSVCIFFLGMSKGERIFVENQISKLKQKFFKLGK